ncbi:MAG: hypothetical protein JWP36_2929 [Paucimonas sp.]|nr:hypothetical protein [Paucimonas sp.]
MQDLTGQVAKAREKQIEEERAQVNSTRRGAPAPAKDRSARQPALKVPKSRATIEVAALDDPPSPPPQPWHSAGTTTTSTEPLARSSQKHGDNGSPASPAIRQPAVGTRKATDSPDTRRQAGPAPSSSPSSAATLGDALLQFQSPYRTRPEPASPTRRRKRDAENADPNTPTKLRKLGAGDSPRSRLRDHEQIPGAMAPAALMPVPPPPVQGRPGLPGPDPYRSQQRPPQALHGAASPASLLSPPAWSNAGSPAAMPLAPARLQVASWPLGASLASNQATDSAIRLAPAPASQPAAPLTQQHAVDAVSPGLPDAPANLPFPTVVPVQHWITPAQFATLDAHCQRALCGIAAVYHLADQALQLQQQFAGGAALYGVRAPLENAAKDPIWSGRLDAERVFGEQGEFEAAFLDGTLVDYMSRAAQTTASEMQEGSKDREFLAYKLARQANFALARSAQSLREAMAPVVTAADPALVLRCWRGFGDRRMGTQHGVALQALFPPQYRLTLRAFMQGLRAAVALAQQCHWNPDEHTAPALGFLGKMRKLPLSLFGLEPDQLLHMLQTDLARKRQQQARTHGATISDDKAQAYARSDYTRARLKLTEGRRDVWTAFFNYERMVATRLPDLL